MSAAVFSAIDVTAPDAPAASPGRRPRGHLDDQRRRRRAASSASGWSGGVWSLAARHAADTAASYTPPGRRQRARGHGYRVYVYYRAGSGDAWSVGGLAAGTVDVSADLAFSAIDVTAPRAAASPRARTSRHLGAQRRRRRTGQFSVWLVNGRRLVRWPASTTPTTRPPTRRQVDRQRARAAPATGSTSTTGPAAATPGASAASPGVGRWGAGVFSAIDVTAPDGGPRAPGAPTLAVTLDDQRGRRRPGEFSVWVVKYGGWYAWPHVDDADTVAQLHAAAGALQRARRHRLPRLRLLPRQLRRPLECLGLARGRST